MNTIVTICARGGSVGAPGKNIAPLHGKPLIAHTIDQAKALEEVSRVCVSTDCPRIAAIAREYGAETPFLRPPELATSDASKLDAIAHLVNWVEADGGAVDRIVDLDPTSPLRSIDDIRTCIAMLDEETDVVITGSPAEKNPYFNMIERKPDGAIRPVKQVSGVVSRQQAPAVYSMNASVYVWWRRSLSKGLWDGRVRLHVMPRERSVDIDEPIDFMIVEALMRRRVATDAA